MSTDKFIRVAVIGHPVGHSKSPLIHNYWIKKYGLPGAYEALDLPPENLGRALLGLAGRGYSGFNLTIPHKERALDICDHVDALARSVGAVNAIKVVDGALYGTNTDVFGFIENIKQNAPDFDFTAGPAVVLGAGGAAHAVVHGLLQQGCSRIYLVNRTRDKAEILAGNSGAPARIEIFDWAERTKYLPQAGLLVNTTALGMEGQKKLDLNIELLNPAALVNDIVYTPLHTDLLKEAKKRGNPVVTGIGMLLHQARPAFEWWFGQMPEIDDELMARVLT